MTSSVDRDASPTIVNAMTIDLEDYFHVTVFDGLVARQLWDRMEYRVCANTERLLKIFEAAGVRATFFILGWVAERFPDLVRRVAAAGHELASHGYAHRLVYDQSADAFRDDVRRSKDLLESIASQPIHGFRAPSYSITARSLWALDILLDEGFRYDASIFPIRHDRYGIPAASRHPYVIERSGRRLIEIPATTVRWGFLNLPVGGGGYFRILPYAWTRWGIRHVNRREGKPAVFYLHPWELDPDQPRIDVGLLGRFRHYRNLAITEGRLRRLLDEFRFTSMTAAFGDVRPAPSPAWAAEPLPYVW